MEKFTMVGNIALHYTDTENDGTVIVLLHGYLESLEVWGDFAALLHGSGYRIITIDLPGHGISEVISECHSMEFLADATAGLLAKLDIKKYCVLGHSMGGYVALAIAAKYSERLSAIVLFSSTPNADTDEKRENRKREIEIIKAGKKELLSKTNPEKGFAKENRKHLIEVINDFSLQVMLTEDEGIIALLNGMSSREDMNEMLRNLKIPQLFIFGKKDEYISAETAQSVATNHPQAEVCYLENSGHNGFIEEPVKSLEILENFLK